jgi:putative nucleotidyltransferase with HDIG domain
LYISATVAAAMVATGVLVSFEPTVTPQMLHGVIVLGIVALLTQILGFTLARTAQVSISFVPFLASAAIAPHWTTTLAVLLLTLPVQLAKHGGAGKTIFKTAQQCLAISLAILAYRITGGESLLYTVQIPYVQLLVQFITFFVVNNMSVGIAVALSEETDFWDRWRVRTLRAIPYDILACPIIMGLAWIYAKYGAPGAFAFAVPLLGLRQLYKTNIDLDKINQDMLELMVAAIEARDPYTSGHSRRVSHNAKIIAQILGLRPSQVRRIETAALLHDVGKIHEVFAPILQKPGRLTEEESLIMQAHPVKSAELVAKVAHLQDIVAAVRHHHENWDGSGYPDGLAGTEIPLASRIIMFADTIDAMTSDRPYRRALDPETVRAELLRYRGRQFDPYICDAILNSSRYDELFRHMPDWLASQDQKIQMANTLASYRCLQIASRS